MSARPIPSAGVVCFRASDVLLVRRATAPRAGEWSLPGGRLEAGETPREAALRELREETGVTARLLDLIEVVNLPDGDGPGFEIHDFAAAWLSGEPRPGGDVDRARFLPLEAALDAVAWAKTREVIVRARALVPR